MKFGFKDRNCIRHVDNHIHWRNLFLVVFKHATVLQENSLFNGLVDSLVN
jgi:hypothetical protein